MGKEKIGFIGTGVMGKSMVTHLLNAGHEVFVYNRTKEKTAKLVEKGAIFKDSPKEVALASDIVMTMVGFPADVAEVYFNENFGVFSGAKEGMILIDLTTSSPSLAVEIAVKAKEDGILCLDAPVSGGDVGAQNATLTIMCGGEEEAFQKAKDILLVLGKNVILQGAAGAGQHTKMCNQLAIASGMLGVCEALAYADRCGLSSERVLESISGGAAGSWSLSNYGPRILNGDFEAGFFIKHFIKDLRIALEEAEKLKLELPGAKLAKKLYEILEEDNLGEKGTQALFLWYQNQASYTV